MQGLCWGKKSCVGWVISGFFFFFLVVFGRSLSSREEGLTFETCRLFQTHHNVHVLYRLSGCSFDDIVDDRNDDSSAGKTVGKYVHGTKVGASNVSCLWSNAVVLNYVNKWFIFVGLFPMDTIREKKRKRDRE